MHQGVVALARFHDDVATFAAIAAGGASAGNELLPPECEAAIAAVARLHLDCCLIDEHAVVSLRSSVVSKTIQHKSLGSGPRLCGADTPVRESLRDYFTSRGSTMTNLPMPPL